MPHHVMLHYIIGKYLAKVAHRIYSGATEISQFLYAGWVLCDGTVRYGMVCLYAIAFLGCWLLRGLYHIHNP